MSTTFKTAKNIARNILITAAASVMLVGCANTKLTQSWADSEAKHQYDDLLIIGIAESEQNRRAWESYFVESLVAIGAEGEASYRLLKSGTKIERETVKAAIEGTGIQAVMTTHLIAVDEETVYRPSVDYMPVYGTGYYGGLYSYYPHVNSYVTRPGYYTTHETYTLETNLYDVESEELVYSARSRTFSPESADEVIGDLTNLLIKDMKSKGLLKKK